MYYISSHYKVRMIKHKQYSNINEEYIVIPSNVYTTYFTVTYYDNISRRMIYVFMKKLIK